MFEKNKHFEYLLWVKVPLSGKTQTFCVAARVGIAHTYTHLFLESCIRLLVLVMLARSLSDCWSTCQILSNVFCFILLCILQESRCS